MSLLHEILAGLESIDPSKAAALRSELESGAGAPAEPQAPPTLLDELREDGYDAAELAVSEIPNGHEVPVLLGLVVKHLLELNDRVAELEAGPASAPPEPLSAGQVVRSAPANDPAQPDTPPAPAPVFPAPDLAPVPAPDQAPEQAPADPPAPDQAPAPDTGGQA